MARVSRPVSSSAFSLHGPGDPCHSAPMSGALFQRQIKVRQGAHLPHWTSEGASYHVVFRLADSLPIAVVEQYRAERDRLRAAALAKQIDDPTLSAKLRTLFSERVESALDCGAGECWLARDDIASLTDGALRHFKGSRYELHAWCVMPNHVHAVMQPLAGHALPAIMKSWKGFIARAANRQLNRTGEFWQPEYYDHLIRDAPDFAHAVEYVRQNPEKAGLKNWRWVWP